MLETTEVKGSKTTVRTHRYKDIRRSRQPSNIVYLTIVSNELRNSCRCVDIPDGTRCINRRGHYKTRSLLVPRKVGQRRACGLILDLGLLYIRLRK